MSSLLQDELLHLRSDQWQRLHRCWACIVSFGGVLMFLGGLAVASPVLTELTTLATVFLCGCFLIGGGLVQLANAFMARSWQGFVIHLLVGLVDLVLGVLMIEHPGVMAAALTLVLACGFLIGGALRVIYPLLERFPGWGWTLLNGAITLLLGLMIWRQWPDSADWVIGLFVGIELLFNGWSWVMLGLFIKAAGPQGPTAATGDRSLAAH